MQSINEFYDSMDAAGIPKHYTHDIAEFETSYQSCNINGGGVEARKTSQAEKKRPAKWTWASAGRDNDGQLMCRRDSDGRGRRRQTKVKDWKEDYRRRREKLAI